MAAPFHPFDPVGPRRALFAAAAVSASLAGATLATSGEQPGLLPYVRAALFVAFGLAFALLHRRLAPRAGFGVTLTAHGVLVSRPLGRAPLELPWEEINALARPKGRRALVLALREGGKLVVRRHLFPSAAAFEALASALEDRLPAPAHDA